MTYYYARVEDVFINYLFKKDMTFMRLRDTIKLFDTITYNDDQIEFLKKLHPNLIKLRYRNATNEMRSLPSNRVDELHLQKILNFLS